MANHKIPKCPKCGRYMTLRHRPVWDDRAGLWEWRYYCDNPQCPHQKETICMDTEEE